MPKESDFMSANYYENPILRGFNPDPSVLRVGVDYYMVNSTFQYFPGVIIRHSRDLVHWEIIGHAFTENDNLPLNHIADSHGIWAPDISYHNGLYYIFAPFRLNNPPENKTGRLRQQLVVTSEKPEGPYSKPFVVDVDSIDPSHFVDDDGTHYMIHAPGITITKLTDDCSDRVGDSVQVWPGTGLRAAEGPHILKKDGYYYAILAEGGTGYGHQISVGRSKNLHGPYESSPYNPVMKQTDPTAKLQRSGHGKLVQTQDGDWWAVYLCARPNDGKYTSIGRETALDPVRWTDDGWFVINELKGPSERQMCPDLPQQQYPDNLFDDFDGDNLGLHWQFVRNPKNEHWSLAKKKGFLAITPCEYDLCELSSYNTLVRREEELRYTATTKVLFSPSKGEEAGLTCYYGVHNYIKLCLTYDEGLRVALVEYRNDTQTVINTARVEQEEVYLRVVTDGLTRSFYYSLDNECWNEIGIIGDCSFLSDEGGTVGKHHTGTMVGVYAYNGGGGVRQKDAYFDWFEVTFSVHSGGHL